MQTRSYNKLDISSAKAIINKSLKIPIDIQNVYISFDENMTLVDNQILKLRE